MRVYRLLCVLSVLLPALPALCAETGAVLPGVQTTSPTGSTAIAPKVAPITTISKPVAISPIRVQQRIVQLPSSLVKIGPDALIAETDDPVNFIMAPNSPSTEVLPYGKVVWPIAVGDLNNDSQPDVVVNDNFSSFNFQKGINAGRGKLQFSTISLEDQYMALKDRDCLAIADVTGDGRQDLVMVCSYMGDAYQNVTAYPGKPDGTFGPPAGYGAAKVWDGYSTMMDTNGDGRQDLVMMSPNLNGIVILNGTGSGLTPVSSARRIPLNVKGIWRFFAFAPATTKERPMLYMDDTFGTGGVTTVDLSSGQTRAGSSSYRNPVAAADLNRDGLTDIISTMGWSGLAYADSWIYVHMKNKYGGYDNTFSAKLPVTFNSGAPAMNWIKVADFNSDGNQDIVVADYGAPKVIVLLGDGAGNFVQKGFDLQGTTRGVYSISTADVDKDNRPDLILGLHALNSAAEDGKRLAVLRNITSTTNARPQLAVAALPTAYKGMDYRVVLSCIGGAPRLTWSLAFGSLPPGLSLDPGTGAISGNLNGSYPMPTFNFGVTVTDSAGRTHSRDYQIQVAVKPALAVQCNGQAVQSFDFGRVNIPGSASAEFTTKLTDTSLTGVKVSIYSVKIDNPAFVVDSFTTQLDRLSIPEGRIKFHFTPVVNGTINTTMHIATSVPDAPMIDIAIIGEGYRNPDPTVTIDFPYLKFPDTKVGSQGEAVFTLGNIGSNPLILSKAELNSTQFSMVTQVAGVSIPCGGSYPVRVRFSPQSAGGASSSVRIYTNDPKTQTLVANLIGTGLP